MSDTISFLEALRPVPPPDLYDTLQTRNLPVSLLRDSDGAYLLWLQDGNILEIKEGYEERLYVAKPTYAFAVDYACRHPSSGSTFQFFKDGSVKAHYSIDTHIDTHEYYWGPDQPAFPESGEEIHPVPKQDGTWSFPYMDLYTEEEEFDT